MEDTFTNDTRNKSNFESVPELIRNQARIAYAQSRHDPVNTEQQLKRHFGSHLNKYIHLFRDGHFTVQECIRRETVYCIEGPGVRNCTPCPTTLRRALVGSTNNVTMYTPSTLVARDRSRETLTLKRRDGLDPRLVLEHWHPCSSEPPTDTSTLHHLFAYTSTLSRERMCSRLSQTLARQ